MGSSKLDFNNSWKTVIFTTIGIYLAAFILGIILHAQGSNSDVKQMLPESYVQSITSLKTISIEDAYNDYTRKKAVFIDARDNAEYVEGHIKGAINIPYDKFDGYYQKYEGMLPKGRMLITYCHGIGCGLSVDVAKHLIAMGYINVYVLTEGWPGWVSANLPTSVGKEP